MSEAKRQARVAALKAAAGERILFLDGAKGAYLQRVGLTEADFRGNRFADWARLAEQIALAEIEIVVEEIENIALCLDAFGDQVEAEACEKIFEIGRMNGGGVVVGIAKQQLSRDLNVTNAVVARLRDVDVEIGHLVHRE